MARKKNIEAAYRLACARYVELGVNVGHIAHKIEKLGQLLGIGTARVG